MLIVYEQVTSFLGWEGYLSWTQYCVLSYVYVGGECMDLVASLISMQLLVLECCISSMQGFWMFSCTCIYNLWYYALFNTLQLQLFTVLQLWIVACTGSCMHIAAYKAVSNLHDSDNGVSSEDGPTCNMKSGYLHEKRHWQILALFHRPVFDHLQYANYSVFNFQQA